MNDTHMGMVRQATLGPFKPGDLVVRRSSKGDVLGEVTDMQRVQESLYCTLYVHESLDPNYQTGTELKRIPLDSLERYDTGTVLSQSNDE